MMAVTPLHRSSSPQARPLRAAALLIALTLAFGSMLVAAGPVSAQEATPTVDELETLRQQAIDDGVDQLELAFQEFNDSGIEGTATLYDLDDETLIAIQIDGGGDEHPAFILEGTCGDTEPSPVERLAAVDETGASLSLIERSLSSLIDEDDFVIDMRLSPNELGVLIACTNIDGTAVPATPVDDAITTPVPDAPTEPAPTETPTPEPTIAPALTETPVPEPTAVLPTPDAEKPEQDGTGGPKAAPDAVASLPLMDYSALGVTGTISLIALDASTTSVRIVLTGEAVTGGHTAHLHRGTCEKLRDEGTIHLASVGADGISETTVGVPLTELLTGVWSVNVHLSEEKWDTWLVCGYLGDATEGMTGVQDVTPIAGGPITTPTSTVSQADGTSGVSGKGEPTETSTLAQGVGVGSTLIWPGSPTQSVALALAIYALVLIGAGGLLRRGQRAGRIPVRWQRLGL
jgi:hypothetical protein